MPAASPVPAADPDAAVVAAPTPEAAPTPALDPSDAAVEAPAPAAVLVPAADAAPLKMDAPIAATVATPAASPTPLVVPPAASTTSGFIGLGNVSVGFVMLKFSVPMPGVDVPVGLENDAIASSYVPSIR
jgi:hypothetical protein